MKNSTGHFFEPMQWTGEKTCIIFYSINWVDASHGFSGPFAAPIFIVLYTFIIIIIIIIIICFYFETLKFLCVPYNKAFLHCHFQIEIPGLMSRPIV
jgi:hypothetical protein